MSDDRDPLDVMLERARGALSGGSIAEARPRRWSDRARALARDHVTRRVLWALIGAGLLATAIGYGLMQHQRRELLNAIELERGWAVP